MRTTFALIAAIAAVTSIATKASANETFTVDVEVADLDLTTERGVNRLNDRIERAVRENCRTGQRGMTAIRAENACRAAALASADTQVRFAIAEANAAKSRLAYNTTSASLGAPKA